MAQIITLDTLDHPLAAPYASLTEAQLRDELHPGQGLFIAESPKVIRLALDAGCEPVSLMCERKHIEGDAAGIIADCPADMPLLTGSRGLLASITGYTLTRGVLCAMRRPVLPSLADIAPAARRIAVIDSVTDTTNIGAIFRSAAALGIDAVAVTPTTCDPLNRRAVRVSMGTVFKIPWCRLGSDPYGELREAGFQTIAMALTHRSVPVDDPVLRAIPRAAIVLGTEGDGLPQAVIDGADYVARIPMQRGVNSLNVAAAAALTFWQLR